MILYFEFEIAQFWLQATESLTVVTGRWTRITDKVLYVKDFSLIKVLIVTGATSRIQMTIVYTRKA